MVAVTGSRLPLLLPGGGAGRVCTVDLHGVSLTVLGLISLDLHGLCLPGVTTRAPVATV